MQYYTAIRNRNGGLSSIGVSSSLKTAIGTLRRKMPNADEEGFIFRSRPGSRMNDKEIERIAIGRMYLEEAEMNGRFYMCCMYEHYKTGDFYYVYSNGKTEKM